MRVALPLSNRKGKIDEPAATDAYKIKAVQPSASDTILQDVGCWLQLTHHLGRLQSTGQPSDVEASEASPDSKLRYLNPKPGSSVPW